MPLPNLGRSKRAPRVNIPSRESALIDVGGKRITVGLYKLSITGGCLLTKPVTEGRLAGITLQTTSGKIESAIQFLKPDGAGRQGFRFVQLDPANGLRLQNALAQMRKQGLGDGSSSVMEFCANTARKVVEKTKSQIGR